MAALKIIAAFKKMVHARGGIVITTDEDLRTSKKALVECMDGHRWEKAPCKMVAEKTWCPACRLHRMSIENLQTISEAKGGRCLASVRRGYRDPLPFKCATGHEWMESPYAIAHSGSWCPHCVSDRSKTTKEESADGLLKLTAICAARGGRCIGEAYRNTNTVSKYRCNLGHEWETRASNIFAGRWCPECAGTYGEKEAIKFVRAAIGSTFKKCRPSWLRGERGRALELDAFCETLMLAIEYQGQQHYKFAPLWHESEAAFRASQGRDAHKRKLCAEHGVTLFEIPYVHPPTPEKIKAQIERLAQEACLPYDFNPEYRAFKKELAEAASQATARRPVFLPRPKTSRRSSEA